MSESCTLPVKRAEIGPILTAEVAFISVSDSFSRFSQPGMPARNTSGSTTRSIRFAAGRESAVRRTYPSVARLHCVHRT